MIIGYVQENHLILNLIMPLVSQSSTNKVKKVKNYMNKLLN